MGEWTIEWKDTGTYGWRYYSPSDTTAASSCYSGSDATWYKIQASCPSPPAPLPSPDPPKEFSPHVNASDMVAEFIRQVRSLGVPNEDVLQLPLHLFIAWLIIEAAESSGEQAPADVLPIESDPVITLAARPKCLACGRFIRRRHYRHRFPYCNPQHAGRHLLLSQ